MFMLVKSQFCQFLTLTMSNSDVNGNELENSPTPTSINLNGSPNMLSISKTPNFENSLSTAEVNKRSCVVRDEILQNSTVPTSINPTGSSISVSISKSPNLENQASVSHSKKRSRIGDENDDNLQNSTIPTLINATGSPNVLSISETPKFENQVSVSRSTKELKKRHETDITEEIITKNSPKRRRLGEEIDENDEGFTTPTDLIHKIPKITQCPPAPRKPNSRRSKSPPPMVAVVHRNIFPVDVSEEEAESLFPPRVED